MRWLTLLLLACLWLGSSLGLQAQDQLTLAFVGDVDPGMLSGQSAESLERLARATSDCAARLANLECCLTHRSAPLASKAQAHALVRREAVPPKSRDYLLQAPPETAPLLAKAGFNLVNLANNHSMDYGLQGMKDTWEALRGAGLSWCGAGQDAHQARSPVVMDLEGARVAFIGYSEIAPLGSKATDSSGGIAWIAYPEGSADRARVEGSIRQARDLGADLVVVSLHWGLEGSGVVEPYQRQFAHYLLDHGADCVIGHHPHVLRDRETYQGKTIAYSLGNFLFNYSSHQTVLLKIHFQRRPEGGWSQQAEPMSLPVRGGMPQAFRPTP